MTFEWDNVKNEKNIKKHKIPFDIAVRVFADKKRIEKWDSKHSTAEEDRFFTIGMVSSLLFVVFTERKENIRIISARYANQEETHEYYSNYDAR